MRKYLTKDRVFVIVGLLVLVLGLTSCSGDANKYLMPILSIVPMQYLAYKVSVLKEINPDQPRNLAKSVTVE